MMQDFSATFEEMTRQAAEDVTLEIKAMDWTKLFAEARENYKKSPEAAKLQREIDYYTAANDILEGKIA